MSPRTSRRLLLGSVGAAATVGLSYRLRNQETAPPPPLAGSGSVSTQVFQEPPPNVLSQQERATLQALQSRMLPSVDGSPSSTTVGATVYLERLIEKDILDIPVKKRLLQGLARLDTLSIEHQTKRFSELSAPEQDAIIREIYTENNDGEEFYNAVLDYSLEAFLGAPSHGGNPRGMVWAWIGFPRGSIGPWQGNHE